MFSKLVVLSHEIAGLVHANQKPEDCLIPLYDGQMKRRKTMLVSLHIQGMQGLPSEFYSGNSVEVSFIFDLPFLRSASVMSFESRAHFFSLSGINLRRPFFILVGLGLFPFIEVAEVFEPIQLNGIMNSCHSVLVCAQRAHAFIEQLLKHFEVLALHGKREGIITTLIDDESGEVLITD